MMQSGFWWILFSIGLYGIIHSVLASHSVKRWVEKRVGTNIYQRYYRLFFSLQAFFLFLPILALVVLLPDVAIYRIPRPWVWLTLIIQFGAVYLLLNSIFQTGALRFTGFAQAFNIKGATRSLPLVERGMYRFVRHPIYTCMFVITWLFPIMSWNVLAIALGVSAYNIIGAHLEERKLLQEFGEAYNEYRRKTPFMFPGLKLSK
ncbi:MAG: hypothetical protein CVU46_15460 [Chloroflexi bacterium HGW-Chloroflexi-8]|jgi:protein-S-isoprenylcysteine O-methyltransferase Ste14|nr:MAG: hypothetical protein CVU46_15460 [Chloroflexi bacterium HGW-Chloroflexi-8]